MLQGSVTPESASKRRYSPQKSSPTQGTKSVDVSRQASNVNNEIGNTTTVRGTKQAPYGGRKVTETTTTNKFASAKNGVYDTLTGNV